MHSQSAIFHEGNAKHWFLEYTITDASAVPAALATIVEVANGQVPSDSVQLVVSFGARLANELFPGEVLPTGLHDLQTIQGPAHSFAAVPVDLALWVHSDRHDRNFDVALAARRALEAAGTLLQDVAAWQYLDSRDLTGFIDGTENPSAEEAKEFAVVADGPGAGGALMFTQRWVHDLDAFHALPVEDQQQIIGRTKPDSVELEPGAENSHIGRVVMEDEAGDEIEIYRRSMPYGDATEAGLFFLAFPGDLAVVDAMLARMVGNDGPHDRLIDYSQAVSGAYTFAPSAEALAQLLGS